MSSNTATQQPSYKVAIIGVETILGQEVLNHLHERSFPVSALKIAGEDKNQLKQMSFGDDTLQMIHADTMNMDGFDVVFLTGTEYVAKKIIQKLENSDAKIIDLTDTDGKLLAIPDLGYAPSKTAKIIASPSSATIQLVSTLKALEEIGTIETVTVSTYHSVSEVGRPAMDELFNQVRTIYMNQEPKTQHFSKHIAFNVIPQVGGFEDNHATGAEHAIITETASLMESEPKVAATCVYTPVFVGHGQSVTVQFKDTISVKDIKAAWRASEGIEIIDLESEMEFVTPSEIHGETNVFLSRIRANEGIDNSLSYWSVMDNLQSGAAYNSVRIAESPAEISSIDDE